MSVETRKVMWDIVKMFIGIMLSVSAFLATQTYNEQQKQYDKIEKKLDQISTKMDGAEMRLIRVEYELKLK